MDTPVHNHDEIMHSFSVCQFKYGQLMQTIYLHNIQNINY
jgi:hypothetical protein